VSSVFAVSVSGWNLQVTFCKVYWTYKYVSSILIFIFWGSFRVVEYQVTQCMFHLFACWEEWSEQSLQLNILNTTGLSCFMLNIFYWVIFEKLHHMHLMAFTFSKYWDQWTKWHVMVLPTGHFLNYCHSTCMQLVVPHFPYNKILPPNYSYTLEIKVNQAKYPT
jgi:hypothetical protein